MSFDGVIRKIMTALVIENNMMESIKMDRKDAMRIEREKKKKKRWQSTVTRPKATLSDGQY